MEPEADPVSAASEMDAATDDNVKEEESEDPVEEESTDKKQTPVLCTLDQLNRLAQQLGAEWKKLAPKLGFKEDEVSNYNFIII